MSNPNIETRNPKQFQNSNAQKLKSKHFGVSVLLPLNLYLCFMCLFAAISRLEIRFRYNGATASKISSEGSIK